MTVAGPPPVESSTAPASPTRIASDRVGVSSVVSSAGCRRPSPRLPSTSIRIQTGRVVFNTTRDGETPRFSTVSGGAGDDAIAAVPLDALFEGTWRAAVSAPAAAAAGCSDRPPYFQPRIPPAIASTITTAPMIHGIAPAENNGGPVSVPLMAVS
jgi:hypothetical protein